MTTRARCAALLGGLTLALALTGCGGEETSDAGGAPPASQISAEHNEADARFARQMIPHHRQAVEMTGLAADRAESDDVQALAEEISAAQQPEIDTMTTMLEKWGAAMSGGAMEGMDMGGTQGMGGMQGMMSPQQMTELANASGAQFDRLFLEMMIAHHEGAVEMARAEQVDGMNPQAIELAGQIESTQLQEIERMQQLLSS